MANPIYVCCRSSAPVTYGELEDFMGHMGFLDEDARFEPPLDDGNRNDAAWRGFKVHVHGAKQPIAVRHWTTRDQFGPTLDELREEIEDKTIASHLGATQQVIVFDLPAELPQDAWEMLDATEAHLAQRLDGIVVADDGVYDAKLERLITR